MAIINTFLLPNSSLRKLQIIQYQNNKITKTLLPQTQNYNHFQTQIYKKKA